MWCLTIRSPSAEPTEVVLRPGRVSLGRKSDNDVVIADESASRYHAEITWEAETDLVLLRDLGSTNGTFVNRESIAHPHVLRPGDQVRIGQYTLTVSRPDEVTQAARVQHVTRELVLASVDAHAMLMYEVAVRLNTILDLESALAEVSQLTRVSLGVEKCEIILMERFAKLQEMGFPTSIARQAIDQKSVVLVPDVAAEPDQALGQSALLLHLRSVLCAPVLVNDEVVGLTYAYKTSPQARPFDQNDLRLMVAISHQAALTVQRTRLLEKARLLEALAAADDLTGLLNRRAFLQLGQREFQRARRYGRPLFALLLDIDHFKQVNDAYGHAVGDEVLRTVADRLRSGTREIDVLGRYSGEEFALLLPENILATAHAVAERLRRALADRPIDTAAGPVTVTASIGLAGMAYDCGALGALLEQADAALFAAKHHGRNCIEVWGSHSTAPRLNPAE